MRKIGILLFALALGGSANVQAQSLKDLYPADAEVVVTPLPFAWEKCSPYLDPVVEFTWEKGKGLPLFSAKGNATDNDTTYHFLENGKEVKGFVHLPKTACYVIDDKIVSQQEWDSYLGSVNTYFTSEDRGDTLYHIIVTVKPADCIGKFFSPCHLRSVLHDDIYNLPAKSLVLLYFWDTACTPCFKHVETLDSLNVMYLDKNVFVLVRNRYLKDFPVQNLKQVKLVWDKVEKPVHTISSTCMIIDDRGKVVDYIRYLDGKQDVENVFKRLLSTNDSMEKK